eukprot:SAG31_NODE_674_length_12909_cov_25.961124_4_plen_34_part_00
MGRKTLCLPSITGLDQLHQCKWNVCQRITEEMI